MLKKFRVYNPFIPHIVQFKNGKYAVRRMTIFGWFYCDKNDYTEWWPIEFAKKYCTVDTIEQAVYPFDKGEYIAKVR